MSERDIRKEIEATDAALRDARRELAQLQERAAGAEKSKEVQLLALRAQQQSIETALGELERKTSELRNERAELRDAISAGRQVLESNRPPDEVSQPPLFATSITEVVRPTGWRKGQPWYSRLLWWLLQAQEWK
jgi:hypothetical protein